MSLVNDNAPSLELTSISFCFEVQLESPSTKLILSASNAFLVVFFKA
jgi:hypothetical protein